MLFLPVCPQFSSCRLDNVNEAMLARGLAVARAYGCIGCIGCSSSPSTCNNIQIASSPARTNNVEVGAFIWRRFTSIW